MAPSKQESTTYEPSLVCKLLILGCRLLIPDRLLEVRREARRITEDGVTALTVKAVGAQLSKNEGGAVLLHLETIEVAEEDLTVEFERHLFALSLQGARQLATALNCVIDQYLAPLEDSDSFKADL